MIAERVVLAGGTTAKPLSLEKSQDQDPQAELHQGQIPLVRAWTKGICSNCGETEAEVDPDGILWCPVCGYSKKGCYT